MLVQQRPQDPAGDAADQVVAVDEHAAVDGEEADVRDRAGMGCSTAGRRGERTLDGFVDDPIDLDHGRENRQRASPAAASSSSSAPNTHGALDEQHAHELAPRLRRHRQPALDVDQLRQQDVEAEPSAGLEGPPHGPRVLADLAEVDSHGRAPFGGHAHDAVAHRNLRSDARGVKPVAGDRDRRVPVWSEQNAEWRYPNSSSSPHKAVLTAASRSGQRLSQPVSSATAPRPMPAV